LTSAIPTRIVKGPAEEDAIGASAAPMALSTFAEKYIEFKGEPLRFNKYPYMLAPIDDGHRRRIFVWARQTGKSLAQSAVMMGIASMYPYTTATYMSSAIANTSIFESQKLGPMMKSPKWRKEYLTGGGKNNIFEKNLSNGSQIILRGGGEEGRVRGISGGVVLVDELQDIDRDVVETVESVMTREELQIMILGGTQSHLESSVNYYWDISSKNEWFVRCSHCSRWSDALGESNIGLKGLICSVCGGAMNTATDRGEWVITSSPEALFSGYRFPLIALPGHPWQDVVDKRNSMKPRTFAIDVLALPFDFSGKPMSRTELMALCAIEPRTSWMTAKECSGYQTVAGVDWGQGNTATTQICVLVLMGQKAKVAYFKKMLGDEAGAAAAQELVEKICSDYNCQHVCMDKGGQWGTNDAIIKKFGPKRFSQIQLVGDIKKNMTWVAKDGVWSASKVETLAATFMAMKQQKIMLPAWSLFQPFGEEILNEIEVYNEDNNDRLKFEKMPGRADDSLHAMNFARLAWAIHTGEHTKLPGTGFSPTLVLG